MDSIIAIIFDLAPVCPFDLDIDECLSSPCHNNATCNDTDGSYECTCDDGFTGNGTECNNINECPNGDDTHGCHDNATCTDNNGSYECTCDDGYTGDGFNCTSEF